MKLTKDQYRVLAHMRNGMGISSHAHTVTIDSLRRKGLIGQYDCEITKKGNAVMDSYSNKSKAS